MATQPSDVVYGIKTVDGLDDYESILHSGFILERGADGTALYGRTGPYVPPLVRTSFRLIATNEFRRKIENAGLTGMTFRPVTLAKIVRIDWRSWGPDQTSFRYPNDLFPDGDNEPEEYIIRGPHDPDLAMALGALWECTLHQCRGAGVPTHVNFFGPSEDLAYCDSIGAAFLELHAKGGVRVVPTPPPPVFFMKNK